MTRERRLAPPGVPEMERDALLLTLEELIAAVDEDDSQAGMVSKRFARAFADASSLAATLRSRWGVPRT